MTETEPAAGPTLLDRTLGNLRSAWRDIADSARLALGAPLRPSLPREDAERLKAQMAACLEARGGEVSARARAAALGRTYLGLDHTGRGNFLTLLAQDFDVDRAAVDRAVAVFQAATDPVARVQAEAGLRAALEPGRVRLLTQFNALPEGVKFLVDLRAELLGTELLGLVPARPALAALESDLKGLLRSWFDVGFLELRRITWDSPASLLERLIAYEAVHAIRDWQDLKDRLDSDRRCFAFFHPRMPEEPLIFVEVALVTGMAGSIQALLDEAAPVADPHTADTAIFYSISNAQKGLAGISFGNFLIKRVVDDLAAAFPGLSRFATLSPIPGFRRWLATEAGPVLTEGEARALAPLSLPEAIDSETWPGDEALARALRPPLMRACARYLTESAPGTKRARDPVAHFHLSNGARLERLNWLGDVSAKGLRESCGIMINYRYILSDIEANHEAYTGDGRITAAGALRSLVREGR